MPSARRSLVYAIRDQLRAPCAEGGLALGELCEVMVDGRPQPNAGKRFYAVHHGMRTNDWKIGDASAFANFVTLTERVNEPFDRLGTDHLDVLDGLDNEAERVWDCIYQHQWDSQYIQGHTGIMNRANRILCGDAKKEVYEWTEALFPTQMGVPTPVRADWFSARGQQPHKVGNQYAQTQMFCGITIQIVLSAAYRYRNMADARD